MDETAPPTPEQNKEAMQALCTAFYCLNDMLETAGVLIPGVLASNIRRLRTDSAYFNSCLAGIAANLDARIFRPSDRTRPVLLALDGGRGKYPDPGFDADAIDSQCIAGASNEAGRPLQQQRPTLTTET